MQNIQQQQQQKRINKHIAESIVHDTFRTTQHKLCQELYRLPCSSSIHPSPLAKTAHTIIIIIADAKLYTEPSTLEVCRLINNKRTRAHHL